MPKEFELMRKAIKQQLKKDNPNLSDKELEQRSWAIAVAQWKKSHGGKAPNESLNDELLDEEGRIIIAEKAKFYINGNISTIEE